MTLTEAPSAVSRPDTPARAGRFRLGPAEGQLLAWTALALVDAVSIAVTVPMPSGGARIRVEHHLHDAAELISLGVLSAALVWVWQRIEPRLGLAGERRRRIEELGACFVPALLLGAWMLPPDFHGFAGEIAGRGPAWLLRDALVGLVELSIPLTVVVGRVLARGWRRPIGVVAALGVAVLNQIVASHDYPGVHFFAAWNAAVLLGTSVSSFALQRPPSRFRVAGFASAALLSCWSLVVPPPNAVKLELFRLSGSVVAPWLARFASSISPDGVAVISPESMRWFKSREQLAAVPPHEPRRLPRNAIVLLLVGDAMRRDLLDERYEQQLPNLTRLKHDSLDFVDARSCASGTTLSITSIFTGRYPMQILWTDLNGRPYPHHDPGVRFTELLQKSGVDTVNIQGLPGLGRAYGIVRGFSEEEILRGPSSFAGSRQQIPALIRRLERGVDRPFFAYLHFDDAHAPYDSAGKKATPFEGYLAEVAEVDQELGRLLDFLDRSGLSARTSIFFTADHGEAFGEHGKHFHATTVYDELIRVPLLVHIPGVAARKVEEPVSLIDLPETFLDLFGVLTPGGYMGQSWVPLFDHRVSLYRPIFAESDRGHHAMVFRDGFKLIVDDRLHTEELFDLKSDPGELKNLVDTRRDIARQRLAILRAFIKSHGRASNESHGFDLLYSSHL